MDHAARAPVDIALVEPVSQRRRRPIAARVRPGVERRDRRAGSVDAEERVPESIGRDCADLRGVLPGGGEHLIDHPRRALGEGVNVAEDATIGGRRHLVRDLRDHAVNRLRMGVVEQGAHRRRADIVGQDERSRRACNGNLCHRCFPFRGSDGARSAEPPLPRSIPVSFAMVAQKPLRPYRLPRSEEGAACPYACTLPLTVAVSCMEYTHSHHCAIYDMK